LATSVKRSNSAIPVASVSADELTENTGHKPWMVHWPVKFAERKITGGLASSCGGMSVN